MKKKPSLAAPWEITEEMFLNEEEVARLRRFLARRIADADDDSMTSAAVDQLIVELLLFSGLRNSELCRLNVSDTNVGHGEPTLTVFDGDKLDRTIYLPSEINQRIKWFVEQIRPRCLPSDMAPGDLRQPLILNERRKPYDRTALYRRVVRILSEAGLEERASVQLLRHTYGFLAYKRTGGNLLFVQKQLGHAHPMVTAVYAQFVDHPPDRLAELVAGGERSIPTASRKKFRSPRQKGTR